MKKLTKQERYAIINILSQIMKADGVIHPKEEEYMDKVYGELGITIDDLEDAANIEDIHAILIIGNMSVECKDYALKLFFEMAACDGYIDPNEVKVINKILK